MVQDLVALFEEGEEGVLTFGTQMSDLHNLGCRDQRLVCVRETHGVDVVDRPFVPRKLVLVIYLHNSRLQAGIHEVLHVE